MRRPPKLTAEQQKKLAKLEPALRAAVGLYDCGLAKKITSEIHQLLKSTGQELRLLKSKNWYFECLMENGDLRKATQAFRQIRERAPANSRVWLEASTMLAICYLRQAQWNLAEIQIREVLTNDKVIRTPARRAEFRRNSVARFAEETLLAASRTTVRQLIDADEIQMKAETLARESSASSLFKALGEAVPGEAVIALLRIDTFSKKQLPFNEAKLLPSPQQQAEISEVGRTFFEAVKRVIWRSLCDPSSDIYKTWFDHGLKRVMGKGFVGVDVYSALAGSRLGLAGIAITTAAIVIKFGVELYCERYKPVGTMIDHR